ncbi:tyrosinase family oxidase copper chaperone [Streptomyces fungicidicus]|uniref:tyrosinase family oxidase copper chaperone n=1 Tax=Streptomyces fungicidicus TaxID=68203 RepID=UPI0036A29101
MVIGVDEFREGAEPPPAAEVRTRREVTRGLRTGALAAALAPLLTAFRPARPASAKTPDGDSFDQIHRGHRIRGARDADGRWHVTLDGRPLHLMRRADGTWLSMVDHYCSYPAPLDAARAAVEALAPGDRLRTADTAPRHDQQGGRHGVRA